MKYEGNGWLSDLLFLGYNSTSYSYDTSLFSVLRQSIVVNTQEHLN